MANAVAVISLARFRLLARVTRLRKYLYWGIE